MEDLKLQLKKYIEENYIEEIPSVEDSAEKFLFEDMLCGSLFAFPKHKKENSARRESSTFGSVPNSNTILEKNSDETFSAYSIGGSIPNFNMILEKNSGETFSEMLLRLVNESGEKNSAIYNRANIDRRLFSKIVNNSSYQPAKNTVLAFAISLKLNYEMTQKLLDAAGFTLSNKNLSDVIISFFIENKIFDINTINETLYEYKQPLIGGGQKFCRSADDQF